MRLTLRIASWILIAFFTLEVCARVEDWIRYRAPLLANYDLDSIYAYDELGKRGKPHASYLQWHMNEAGYRGPALRSGTFRIVCVGSSETFGLYESASMEWPRQLERKLNEADPNRNFEVVNTALPGMSVGAALQRLPDTLQLHPNVVLIYPSYANYIGRVKPVRTTARPPRQHPGLRMTGRLGDLWKRSAPAPLQDKLRALQVQMNKHSVVSVDRIPDATVAIFESDLDRYVSELERAGVQVVLATHATRFGGVVRPEDRPLLVSWRKSYPELKEDGFLDMEQRMTEALERVAARRQVPVVDAAHEIAPGPENFVEFVHFTDHGAATLASLFAAKIQEDIRHEQAGSLQAKLQVN